MQPVANDEWSMSARGLRIGGSARGMETYEPALFLEEGGLAEISQRPVWLGWAHLVL